MRGKEDWSSLELQRGKVAGGGGIARCLCDALRLRVLAYVVAQPAAFVFVATLFLIAACMPLVAAYVSASDRLPDFYSMRVRAGGAARRRSLSISGNAGGP